MAQLIFDGPQVLDLLAHAAASTKHSAPYGLGRDPGPGLFLVHDDGVYLMSNGQPMQPKENGESGAKVIYAKGYEPPRLIKDEDRNDQYFKIVAAVGGEDFVEFIEAKVFEKIEPGRVLSEVEINLSADRMMVDLLLEAEKPRNG